MQVAPRRGVGLLIAVVLSLIPASGAAYNVYYDMEVPPGIGYGVIGLALGQAVEDAVAAQLVYAAVSKDTPVLM